MKYLLLIALLLASTPAYAQYTQVSEIHCSHDNSVEPTIENMTGYINTTNCQGVGWAVVGWVGVDWKIVGEIVK